MGMYMFVTEDDRAIKRKVSDEELNEEFQEALKYDPSLMIEEREYRQKRGFFSSWFRNYEPETRYTVYHETPAYDGTAYQARYQISGSGSKGTVTAYLHGIINGALAQRTKSK